MDILTRIMNKVKINEEPHPVLGTPCWIWQGSTSIKGYGQVAYKGRPHTVHRLMYQLKVGDTGSLFCCHKCDNPPCCNVDHLFLGTAADNSNDKIAKGRHKCCPIGFKKKPNQIARGERHGFAKLADEQVLEIRRLYPSVNGVELAKMFCVGHTLIYSIIHGRKWKHLLPITNAGDS